MVATRIAATLPRRNRPQTGQRLDPKLLSGIQWTPSFAALLAYLFTTISFKGNIGTEAMAAALLMLPVERTRLRLAAPIVWIAALLGWAFLGLATTNYPAVVGDRLTEMAKVCAIMLVVVSTVTGRPRVRLVLLFTLLCVLFPVRGTFLHYFGGDRLGGRAVWAYTLSNPNDLGAYCLLQLSLALAALTTERRVWIRLSIIVLSGLLTLIILLTASRAASIGLATFALILLARRTSWSTRLKVLTVAAVVTFFVPHGVWERFGSTGEADQDQAASSHNVGATEIQGDEGSAAARLAIWRVAFRLAAENPIFGVGWGAYPEAHAVRARRADSKDAPQGNRDAHSTYFTVLVETGVVGFAFFIGALASVFRELQKAKRATEPAYAGQLTVLQIGLFSFLVAGIWGSYGAMAFFYVHMAFVYAAARAAPNQQGLHRPTAASPHAPISRPANHASVMSQKCADRNA